MPLPAAVIAGLKFAAPIAINAGANYLSSKSAQSDADKARRRAEEENKMLNAVAAFRGGGAPQTVTPQTEVSGATRGYNLLQKLAPLIGKGIQNLNFGGGGDSGGNMGIQNTADVSQFTVNPDSELVQSIMGRSRNISPSRGIMDYDVDTRSYKPNIRNY